MDYRRHLNEIADALRENPPADVVTTSDLIARLASLLGNIGETMTQQERIYVGTYNAISRSEPKLAADKIQKRAQESAAYVAWQLTRHDQEWAIEMIQALKYRQRALQNEWGEGKHM